MEFPLANPTMQPPQPHLLHRDEGLIWTTPQDSPKGSFAFPRTYPLIFREGSSINISWTSVYSNVNLYFYQRGKVATSVQLVSACRRTQRFVNNPLTECQGNLATQWYQWDVRAEERNLTNPFVFRVVDARGTQREQSLEGFWSTSWYLARGTGEGESVAALSVAVSSSATSVLSSTVTSAPSFALTSAESTAPTTQRVTAETTPAVSSEAVEGSGVSKGTVIGMTVGLVVAGAVIVVGVVLWLRKRRRNKAVLPMAPVPAFQYPDKAYAQAQPVSYPVGDPHAHFSELQTVPPCYELPEKR